MFKGVTKSLKRLSKTILLFLNQFATLSVQVELMLTCQ
jgi:hypothetical protein